MKKVVAESLGAVHTLHLENEEKENKNKELTVKNEKNISNLYKCQQVQDPNKKLTVFIKNGETGITLIALVITIIVLLILAGVSISMLTGSNGILTQANKAKEVTEISGEKEGMETAVLSIKVTNSDITEDNLKTALDNQFGANKTTIEDNKDGSYTVKMNNESKREYTVEDDGSLLEGTYSKWDGTSSTEPTNKTSNEIHIYTAPELKWLADQVNNQGNTFEGYTIYLENNLDLGGRAENGNWETTANESVKWTAIGKTSTNMLKATFEGNNHIIKDVYVNSTDDYNGIFGNSNSIFNLVMKNSYIKGAGSTGGIVGACISGTIENCHTRNIKVIAKSYCGGVVGVILSGNVVNCSNTGEITSSENYVGGVLGFANTNSNITNCYNIGKIVSSGKNIGGVAGYVQANSNVEDCYNTGEIKGNIYVGGITGWSHSSSIIKSCYNTQNIIGKQQVGGIAGGISTSAIIENSYNIGDITGNDMYVGGIAGHTYISSKTINCYNIAKVTGGKGVGGVVGIANTNSTVETCYNTGEITGKDSTGGVVGIAASIVTKCYNTGKVIGTGTGGEGTGGTGGIVGDCITKNPQDISLCYNSGTVQAAGQVGGISGYLGAQGYAGKETKCYNKGNVICTTNSEEKGEIVGKMANDANVTNCYFYTNDDSRYGVGVINSGGSIETQRAGAKRITNNFNSLDEFITWVEQQQN